MAFIDEIKIYAEAGRGGGRGGQMATRKFVPKGGPAGGDGGRVGIFICKLCAMCMCFQNIRRKKF